MYYIFVILITVFKIKVLNKTIIPIVVLMHVLVSTTHGQNHINNRNGGVAHKNMLSIKPFEGPNGLIEIAKPEDIRLDLTAIQQLMDDIGSGKWINVHGLIIIEKGKLVAEGYWNGSNATKLHDIRSASKSVASILTGIAIQNDFISSIDTKIYTFFPDFKPTYSDTISPEQQEVWLNNLKIEHLLNMTSGFEYDDWYENFRGEYEIQKSRNWVKKAATSKLVRQPGTFYAYNTASLVLLSEIIARTSQMSMAQFANNMLFIPLGIKNWKWPQRKGVIYMGGALRITLRDMSKLGLLMLNDGVWNNQRLVSSDWIKSTTSRLDKNEPSWVRHGFHHHYLWWQFYEEILGTPIKAYYASGNGGQTIMFVPELEMVIGITTGNYNTTLEPQSVQMIREIILPAAIPKKEQNINQCLVKHNSNV